MMQALVPSGQVAPVLQTGVQTKAPDTLAHVKPRAHSVDKWHGDPDGIAPGHSQVIW